MPSVRRRRARPSSHSVGPSETGAPGTRFDVTLDADPFGEAGYAAIDALRDDLRAAGGDAVLVGGATAEEADLRAATERDTKLLVPLVLLVVFAILVVLLRSVAAPLMLMATVVLSFFAAIGLALLVFDAVRRLPGRGSELPAVRLHLPRRAGGRLQHLPDGARARGGAPRCRRATRC